MKFKTVKLGDFVTITMGQSPKSEFYNTNGNGMPFLQGNRTFGLKYPNFDTYTTKVTKEAKAGDVIMSVRAPVGDLNITPVNMCLGRGVCSLRANNNNQNFLFYLMKYYMPLLLNKESGTVFGSVNKNDINNLEINLPPLETQKKIASILSALDDKIELNNKINENLEMQAQAIFKSWFVDFEPFGGVMPEDWNSDVLGSFIEIKRGGSPRPIQDFISDTGLRWLKISDVTSLNTPYVLKIKEHIKETGLKKTVLLKAGSLVLSNSATPGIPKILDVDSCIHDGWLYFPHSDLSNEFLYLLFKYIRNDLVQLGNGSVFTNLKTDILRQFNFNMPTKNVLNSFQKIIHPMFNMMLNIARENQRLAELRDTLLPKLMNGEIDVDDVQVKE